MGHLSNYVVKKLYNAGIDVGARVPSLSCSRNAPLAPKEIPMVVRARMLAAFLVVLSAVPVLSHADETLAPTLACQAGSVSISYGDGGGFSGVSLGATTADGSVLTGLRFTCEEEGIFYFFQHDDGGHQLVHDFAVDFGHFSGENTPAQTLPFDTVERRCDPCGPAAAALYITDFNLYIPRVGPVSAYNDFIGVQVESVYGFSQGGNFFVDGNGDFVFDPTVPGGEATVSLFDTPVPAPEPSSSLLMGSGFAAGVVVLRRKLRK